MRTLGKEYTEEEFDELCFEARLSPRPRAHAAATLACAAVRRQAWGRVYISTPRRRRSRAVRRCGCRSNRARGAPPDLPEIHTADHAAMRQTVGTRQHAPASSASASSFAAAGV